METGLKSSKRILMGVLQGAIVALVLLSGSAQAGKLDEAKRQQARQRFDAGAKFYNLREYDRSLAEFKEAYLLSGEPELLFNLGQCERQLGRIVDARKSFLAFLREGRPNEEQRKEVEKLIAALDATLKEEEKAKPVTPAPQAVVAVVETPAATPSPKKKTNALWIGIGVGAVVVVGLAVGLGVGLTRSPTYPNANGRVDGN